MSPQKGNMKKITTIILIFSCGRFDYPVRLSGPSATGRLGKSAFSRAGDPTARDNRSCYTVCTEKKTKKKHENRRRPLDLGGGPPARRRTGREAAVNVHNEDDH